VTPFIGVRIVALHRRAEKKSAFRHSGFPDCYRVPCGADVGGALFGLGKEIATTPKCGAPAPSSEVPDLLDLLLAGSIPRNQTPNEYGQSSGNNLLTFIVAGHETTAPLVMAHISGRVRPKTVQGESSRRSRNVLAGRAATGRGCQHLPYIVKSLTKRLRLYPPAGILSRTAQKHDILKQQRGQARRYGNDFPILRTWFATVYAMEKPLMLLTPTGSQSQGN